jgi:hypothetical protein
MIAQVARRASLSKDVVQHSPGVRGQGSGISGHCKALISQLCRRASLPKDAVQQPRAQGSGISGHCKALISQLCRRASLPKDVVQHSPGVRGQGSVVIAKP